MVEVSGGQLASFEESSGHFAKNWAEHPVLWDRDNRNHDRFGVTSWPSAFLVGRDGRVFWQGNPERMEARPALRAAFEAALETQLSTPSR